MCDKLQRRMCDIKKLGVVLKKLHEISNKFHLAPYQMQSHNVLEHASSWDNRRSLDEKHIPVFDQYVWRHLEVRRGT